MAMPEPQTYAIVMRENGKVRHLSPRPISGKHLLAIITNLVNNFPGTPFRFEVYELSTGHPVRIYSMGGIPQ